MHPLFIIHINHLPLLYSQDTYDTPYTNKDPARAAITSAEGHSSRQSRSDCLPLASKTVTQVSEPLPHVHIPPSTNQDHKPNQKLWTIITLSDADLA